MKLRITFVFSIAIMLMSCSQMCGNKVLSEVRSPNGKWKAVVFDRDCGATTRASTQVSIIRSSANLPDDGGNILILDRAASGTPPLATVEWRDDDSLMLSYDKEAVVTFTVHIFRGVIIWHQHLTRS